MNDANSAVVLMKIVPLDRNSHKSYSNVDLEFASEQELCTLKRSRPDAVSEKHVMELRIQGKDFLATMSAKLIEKCPLKYPLARYMSCLDPRQLATSKDTCMQKMKKILSLLCPAGRVRWGVDDLWRCDKRVWRVHQHHCGWEPLNLWVLWSSRSHLASWCIAVWVHGQKPALLASMGCGERSATCVPWTSISWTWFFCEPTNRSWKSTWGICDCTAVDLWPRANCRKYSQSW